MLKISKLGLGTRFWPLIRCDDKKYEAPKEPKYICVKCGRSSEKKEEICKPKKTTKL